MSSSTYRVTNHLLLKVSSIPSATASMMRLHQIATLGKPFTSMDAVANPNSPKIVVDNFGFAMYFSRSIIPFVRGKEQEEWLDNYPFLKHLGIYAYRKDVSRKITQLPQSSLEIAESLEQLRWLQNGYKIKVGKTDVETVGIDTPQDLEKSRSFPESTDFQRLIFSTFKLLNVGHQNND